MRITVIILNWNRPQDTIVAAESVLAQTYPDFELMIWDNASDSNSRALLEARFRGESRAKLLFADVNYGVAGGRNRAFRQATGDLLLSLDSDAVLEGRDALAAIAARCESDQTIGALSFEVKRPDGHLMWPFSRPAADWRYREFETMRVDGCAFVVRLRVFEEVGGFAEHFSPYGAEDQHFAFKVIGAGYRVIYFPAVIVVHAFADHGRTPQQFAMHVRNMLLIPLELFPMPRGLLSAGKLAAGLLLDSLQQHQAAAFFRGMFRAFTGLHAANRRTMSPEGWRHFRALVLEDKSLGCAAAGRVSFQSAATSAWFYARVLALFLVKGVVRLLALVQPSKKQSIELRALRFCNRFFRTPIDPVPFLSPETFYNTQDVIDYFGLSKRLNAGRAWYKDKRLLEVGCGLGKYTVAASSRGARDVCGIDVNKSSVEFARTTAEKRGVANVSFHMMSVCDLRFEDNSFEGAFSHTVFEHLEDVPRALAEIHRVLKPGGEFIFTFDSFRSRYGAHAGHFVGVPWPCFFFNPETVAAFWTQERDAFLKEIGVSPETTLLQASDRIGCLNRLKVSDLEAMILRSPFKVAAEEPYGQEAPLLKMLPFLKKISSVYEYLRGSAAFRLIKPSPRNLVAEGSSST